MEKEIYSLLKNLYTKNFKTSNDSNNITNIVINEFTNIYFNKYKEFLFENALIYSIRKNNNYINMFNVYNLVHKLNYDMKFQLLTVEYAIYNIYDKLVKNINCDDKIKKEYKDIFKYKNVKLESITNKYRKIILKLVELNEDKEIYEILYAVFNTTNYDNDLINIGKGVLNKNNLKTYKSILIRLILSDNFLHLKSLEKEEELDKRINEINQMYNNDEEYIESEEFKYNYDEVEELQIIEDKLISDDDRNILLFIEDFIDNNHIDIDILKKIKINIYNNFVWYNIDVSLQSYDIDNIKEYSDIVKKIKRINPLFILDIYN